MTIADIKKTAETKMDQSIAAFNNNLHKIRTSSPGKRAWVPRLKRPSAKAIWV